MTAIGVFHGKYLVTFFGDAPMANRLTTDRTPGIMELFASGMNERVIAMAFVIDRELVDNQ
jgi:hypothetical protein